ATEWGMSDKLGPLLYGDNQDEVFLGRSMMQRSVHMSDETQQMVDAEIKRFVEDGYITAQKVIRENIDDLHSIAQALLDFETLTGDETRGLMDGIQPTRPDGETVRKVASGGPSAGKRGRKRPAAGPGPTGETQRAGSGQRSGRAGRASDRRGRTASLTARWRAAYRGPARRGASDRMPSPTRRPSHSRAADPSFRAAFGRPFVFEPCDSHVPDAHPFAMAQNTLRRHQDLDLFARVF